MLSAFAWGLLAASSLLLGAGIAVVRTIHTRALGVIMAFGAGVLLSAVAFELVLPAVESSSWGALTGFLAGAAVFTAGDWVIGRLGYANRKDINAAPTSASGAAIALGSLLDGVPETAVLGLTILQTGEVGVAVLAAVFISNVPEGIASTASLRAGGWSLGRVFGMWSVIVTLSAAASALGYVFLDGASVHVLAFMYAFAGGAILTMLATSMMPEAFDNAKQAAGTATVLGGLAAFCISWNFG
jgi:ZIP family zinc transporter